MTFSPTCKNDFNEIVLYITVDQKISEAMLKDSEKDFRSLDYIQNITKEIFIKDFLEF